MGKEVFIDANVFLEIFLKDSKSEECKVFLNSLQEQNRQALTTDFIMYSCILQVQNKLKSANFIKNAVIFFNSYSNLKIIRPAIDDVFDAIGIIEKEKLDFDDSLVVACMRNYGINDLASLDRHFDKVKNIERIKL
ncbi:type II toxin-antitoxin system VapC family toxin [Candidatus Woesearchaeota archaeon]|nr:type II toxin-antitoxin system VapC family toxin [Candidatus Woesearchaeota archaeon]